MSNDPRLDVLRTALERARARLAVGYPDERGVLAALDSADPLRRALTPGTHEHEAAVQRLAWTYRQQQGWNGSHSDRIRAVLAALRDLA
jgi:hypothetical protein